MASTKRHADRIISRRFMSINVKTRLNSVTAKVQDKKRPGSLRNCLGKYFTAVTGILPNHIVESDVHRLTILYFGVGGLALLGKIPDENREHLIDFIYAHQINVSREHGTSRCGFRGSSFIGMPLKKESSFGVSGVPEFPYDSCHVTMTYSALVTLLILDDDLVRVNRQAVLDGILKLQNYNGSLMTASLFCPEFDARFIFSAVASAYIVDMLDQLNLDAFEKHILDTLSYEGAFAQLPQLEAHAGATYCSVAALHLMGRLESSLPMGSPARQRLVNWLLLRQVSGFCGRPAKNADTCYTFWVGASLKMLGAHQYINKSQLLYFLSSTCDPVVGGFMKASDGNHVDPLHSYLAIAGLSTIICDSLCNKNPDGSTPSDLPLSNLSVKEEPVSSYILEQLYALVYGDEAEAGLQAVVPQLNIPTAAFENLMRIHAKWRAAI